MKYCSASLMWWGVSLLFSGKPGVQHVFFHMVYKRSSFRAMRFPGWKFSETLVVTHRTTLQLTPHMRVLCLKLLDWICFSPPKKKPTSLWLFHIRKQLSLLGPEFYQIQKRCVWLWFLHDDRLPGSVWSWGTRHWCKHLPVCHVQDRWWDPTIFQVATHWLTQWARKWTLAV